MNDIYQDLFNQYEDLRRMVTTRLYHNETVSGEWFFKSSSFRVMTPLQYARDKSKPRMDDLDDGKVLRVHDAPVDIAYVMLTSDCMDGIYLQTDPKKEGSIFGFYHQIANFHFNPKRKTFRIDVYHPKIRRVYLYDLVPFEDYSLYENFLTSLKRHVEESLQRQHHAAIHKDQLD